MSRYLDRTYPAIEALHKQHGVRINISDIFLNGNINAQQEPDLPFFNFVEQRMKQDHPCLLSHLSLWRMLNQDGFQGGIGTVLKILQRGGDEADLEIAKQELQNVLDGIENLLRKHRTCCATTKLQLIQPEALDDNNGTSYIYDVACSTLHNWVWDNIDDIMRARRWSGGWEAWLQVEMANTLQKAFEQRGGEVAREVRVYKNSKEIVDLVAKGRHPFNPSKHFHLLIELKAQGENRKAADFQRVVKEDVKKVIKGKVKEEYQPAQFLSWNFFNGDSRESGKNAIMRALRAKLPPAEVLDPNDLLEGRLRDEIIGPLGGDIVLTEFSADVQNPAKREIIMPREGYAAWETEDTSRWQALLARCRGRLFGEEEPSAQTSNG